MFHRFGVCFLALAAVAAAANCPVLVHEIARIPSHPFFDCKDIGEPVNGLYTCEKPYDVYYDPRSNAKKWRKAKQGLRCNAKGQWIDVQTGKAVKAEAVDCTALKKKAKAG